MQHFEPESTRQQPWTFPRRHTLEQRPPIALRTASDGELIARACGESVTRLGGDWHALLNELPALGPVIAVTRNTRAIHEKRGAYGNVHIDGRVALVLNDAIDLRIFLDHWRHGFAVHDGQRESLQFFDADGTAMHKIYLDSGSDQQAYAELVARHASPDQTPAALGPPATTPAVVLADHEVDVTALRAAWAALQDSHGFGVMLKTFRVGRLQALRLAGPEYAFRVPRASVANVLAATATIGMRVMIFVGNAGTVQIQTGPIRRVVAGDRWLKVRDAGSHLQLRAGGTGSIWVVRKPTRDGHVTSLELFDTAGRNTALLFAERAPGFREPDVWRTLIARLPALLPRC